MVHFELFKSHMSWDQEKRNTSTAKHGGLRRSSRGSGSSVGGGGGRRPTSLRRRVEVTEYKVDIPVTFNYVDEILRFQQLF